MKAFAVLLIIFASNIPSVLAAKPEVDIPEITDTEEPSGSSLNPLIDCPMGQIEYIPMPPFPVSYYSIRKLDSSQNPITERVMFNVADLNATNALLPNISSNVSVGTEDTEGSGGWGFLSFGGKSAKRSYIIDFIKWRGEPMRFEHKLERVIGYGVVGAGVRVRIVLTKIDANASLNLTSLALSAKQGKAEGTISTELIGITSKTLSGAIPFTVDISDSSIQRIIETLAIVRLSYSDPEAKIQPTLLAKMACVSKANKDEKESTETVKRQSPRIAPPIQEKKGDTTRNGG